MANNPVQVVMNSDSYIADVETAGGGNHKDFFADQDEAFVRHRDVLRSELNGVRADIQSSGRELGYAHVTLRSDAWAKSHRPVRALLKPDESPVVGAADVGEILVEFNESGLAAAVQMIDSAELETRRSLDANGVEKVKPSRVRSEVGAVASIRSHGPSDRRDFSAVTSAAWLADPRSGNLFLLQLFESVDELEDGAAVGSRSVRRQREYERMKQALIAIDGGLRLERVSDHWSQIGVVALSFGRAASRDPERAIALHEVVLSALDVEPLVRRIWLPPLVEPSALGGVGGGRVISAFPQPQAGASYPIVGVIDTGVAELEQIEPWVVGRVDAVDPSSQDLGHGTFIAGLICDDRTLNDHREMGEQSCRVYDLGLHVTDDSLAGAAYPQGFVDFLRQLDFELDDARDSGARVFNMSLSVEQHVQDDSYSLFADAIDQICDRHDAIFVLPTGNLAEPQFRPEWPKDPDAALVSLANYRHAGRDRMFQPADSMRSVSVGALCPQSDEYPYVRPSTYSRRGPGMGLGAKPELSHIGGAGSHASGLRSFDHGGGIVEDCGTSFAAPLVAKTLAAIDHAVEGELSREAVLALAVQGSTMPEVMQSKKLSQVARDFVGYGVPSSADALLTTDDHAITLVFHASMTSRREMDFSFQWPQALVGENGKCRGDITMTLVYRPELDIRFGSEAVRANLEAYLRQEKIDVHTGEIKYKGFFSADNATVLERERIKMGQKWSPIKKWHRASRIGVGNSSQWKVVVEPLARSGYTLPAAGVPFTLVLTIADPDSDAPIFNQMRRNLQLSNVQIADIRVSQRIQTR